MKSKAIKLEDFKVMVVGDRCWGKGDTIEEALRKAKEYNSQVNRLYVAYIVHPDTYVDEGNFCFPHGCRPRKIYEHGVKKAKKAKA